MDESRAGSQQPDPMSPEFKEMITRIGQEKREAEAYLETLPYETETIPADELKQVITINGVLDAAIRTYDRRIADLRTQHREEGNPNTFQDLVDEINRETFHGLIKVFDKLDIWSAKFSTDSGGDARQAPEQNPREDSIYYMTSSGICLRLKAVNLPLGFKRENLEADIRGPIQPFNEKVFFVGRGGKFSEKPEIGLEVREYTTIGFNRILRDKKVDGDYQSSIKTYHQQDGKLVAITKPKDLYCHHEGHLVNKIFFER